MRDSTALASPERESARSVFASAWALFLPGWFSRFGGFSYANENLTWQLFAGGGLILVANLLLIARPDQPTHGNPPMVT